MLEILRVVEAIQELSHLLDYITEVLPLYGHLLHTFDFGKTTSGLLKHRVESMAEKGRYEGH